MADLGVGQPRREDKTMIPQIYRLSLGVCNCFLIGEEGTLLIDAGVLERALSSGNARR